MGIFHISGNVFTLAHRTPRWFTPFDALHLVESNGDTIVSSDETYADVTSHLDLKGIDDEGLRNH